MLELNVTDAPLHMVVCVAVIVTTGVAGAPTVIVTGEAVAVGTEGQGTEEVITTVTWSPFAKDEVVNVDALVPALFPFTIH